MTVMTLTMELHRTVELLLDHWEFQLLWLPEVNAYRCDFNPNLSSPFPTVVRLVDEIRAIGEQLHGQLGPYGLERARESLMLRFGRRACSLVERIWEGIAREWES